jgi:hypothetical protein
VNFSWRSDWRFVKDFALCIAEKKKIFRYLKVDQESWNLNRSCYKCDTFDNEWHWKWILETIDVDSNLSNWRLKMKLKVLWFYEYRKLWHLLQKWNCWNVSRWFSLRINGNAEWWCRTWNFQLNKSSIDATLRKIIVLKDNVLWNKRINSSNLE